MSAGTQCPQCAQSLGYWVTFGAPLQRIKCPHCKAQLRYVATGWLTALFFAVWLAMGVVAFALARDDQRGIVLLVALISPGPILETPYNWYLRRRGRLEVRPIEAIGGIGRRQ